MPSLLLLQVATNDWAHGIAEAVLAALVIGLGSWVYNMGVKVAEVQTDVKNVSLTTGDMVRVGTCVAQMESHKTQFDQLAHRLERIENKLDRVLDHHKE